MVAVNHMNHDRADVNGSNPPMLPGSFLYKKGPEYEAWVWHQEGTSPNGVDADMNSKFKWLLCVSTYLTYSRKKNYLTLTLLTVSENCSFSFFLYNVQ